MTAHAETHAPETTHKSYADSSDPRIQLAASLKFEPIELRDFELADKAAGQMMGKLLAFLFCILITLMAGVNIWMMTNHATSTDPQYPGGLEHVSEHH